MRINNLLASHSEAGSAFARMQTILKAPAPYSMLKEVEGLINTVREANDALVAEKRKQALAKLDEKIALFDPNKASPLYEKVVTPLHNLQQKVAEEASVPHISHYLSTLDELVENAFKALTTQPPTTGKDEKKKTKAIKTVKLSAMVKKPYLETESDIDEFLETVKDDLMQAIRNDHYVKII